MLGIERSLREAGKHMSLPLYERYYLLKERLFSYEYEHWAAGFTTGNNHGRSHINRVLFNLNALLGAKPFQNDTITPYELFLAMMSILYHDIGILRGRKDHNEKSALLLSEENNEYIIDSQDKKIISVAVVSHSSNTDIEETCVRFQDKEVIGGQIVRPKVIAALVRFADELDEDFRRADTSLQQKLQISGESLFYWQASQRILGIAPDRNALTININVELLPEDVGRVVTMDNKARAFLSLFAEKLSKINQERRKVVKFLPPELQYAHLLVSVRPLDDSEGWKSPRLFIFSDTTQPKDFVEAFPEVLSDPAKKWLLEALELIRTRKLQEAEAALQRLQQVAVDLDKSWQLQILYDLACVKSLQAQASPRESHERHEALDTALAYITEWFQIGSQGAWIDKPALPSNEILRLGTDSDLRCLLKERKADIVRLLGETYSQVLPNRLPIERSATYAVYPGCVLRGTLIETPEGFSRIEDIREGMNILSVDINAAETPRKLMAKVAQIHTSRETRSLTLNGKFTVTPSQPLYSKTEGWVAAEQLKAGANFLTSGLSYEPVHSAEQVEGYFEVYTLTTDHDSHNYLAAGVVCRNKMPPGWEIKRED